MASSASMVAHHPRDPPHGSTATHRRHSSTTTIRTEMAMIIITEAMARITEDKDNTRTPIMREALLRPKIHTHKAQGPVDGRCPEGVEDRFIVHKRPIRTGPALLRLEAILRAPKDL